MSLFELPLDLEVPLDYHLLDDPFASVEPSFDMQPYLDSLRSDGNYHFDPSEESVDAMLAEFGSTDPFVVSQAIADAEAASSREWAEWVDSIVVDKNDPPIEVPFGLKTGKKIKAPLKVLTFEPGCEGCFRSKTRSKCIGFEGQACWTCRLNHRVCEARCECLEWCPGPGVVG